MYLEREDGWVKHIDAVLGLDGQSVLLHLFGWTFGFKLPFCIAKDLAKERKKANGT